MGARWRSSWWAAATPSWRPLILDLTRRHPDNADYVEGHVYTLDVLGSLAFDQGSYERARGYFLEEVRLTDRLRAQRIVLHETESQRGHALEFLGWIEVLTGHPDAAIAPMREALAIEERAVATRPGDTSAEMDLTEQLSDLGYAELKAGRLDDAAARRRGRSCGGRSRSSRSRRRRASYTRRPPASSRSGGGWRVDQKWRKGRSGGSPSATWAKVS